MSRQFWESKTGKTILSIGISASAPIARFHIWANKMRDNPKSMYRQKYLDSGYEILAALKSPTNINHNFLLLQAGSLVKNLKDFEDTECILLIAALEKECVNKRTEVPPDLQEMINVFSELMNKITGVTDAV